jgi:inactivated superfamily I helicase
MLDPIDADIAIWPAIGSFDRLMLLAKLVNDHKPRDATLSPAEALRLARKLADLIDELEVDLVDFTQIHDIAIDADLAGHWQSAYGQLLLILPAYHAALSARKLMGPAERRNHLLAALERRLAENMVESPIIAVGITTSAKAVARVLRRVALMPNGHVILPGVDLALSDERWDDLSAATDDAQVPYDARAFRSHYVQAHTAARSLPGRAMGDAASAAAAASAAFPRGAKTLAAALLCGYALCAAVPPVAWMLPLVPGKCAPARRHANFGALREAAARCALKTLLARRLY